jgi:hypothetical protein
MLSEFRTESLTTINQRGYFAKHSSVFVDVFDHNDSR